MVKGFTTHLRTAKALLPGDAAADEAINNLRARFLARDDALHAAVMAAFKPVKHKIVVAPEP